jgi:thiamine-phosphate pyrophosphorylase
LAGARIRIKSARDLGSEDDMTLGRGLYLVTRETADDARLLHVVEAALEGGTVAVQYRDKSHDPRRRLRQARALVELCARFDVALIVNDDIELAATAGAAGVHVGEDDAELACARASLGAGAVIGVSCYDDIERARRAAREGADYLAFGSFFSSPTKPGARRATPMLLAQAGELGLPRVAIGGINGDNARALIAAGADQVAVISAIFDAADPRAAARRISNLFVSR